MGSAIGGIIPSQVYLIPFWIILNVKSRSQLMMILTSDTIAKVVSIRSLDIGNSDLAGHLKLFSVEHCWCQTVELSSSGPTNEPSAKRWSPIIFYFLIWDTWILTDFLYFLLASREDH